MDEEGHETTTTTKDEERTAWYRVSRTFVIQLNLDRWMDAHLPHDGSEFFAADPVV